jgi:Zn-dependent protease
MLPAIWLVIFLHELGHCLMALAQGYRFLFITVGPLRLEAAPAGLRLVRNRSWAMAGGVCATVPDALPADRLSSAQQRVLLAGPLASLLIGLSLLLIGLYCDVRFAFAAGAASLGISVATLVPSRQGMLLSDGLAYQTLRRGGPDAERHLARSAIAAACQES